ncbi:hypothetical protein W03_07670 [Nitrosomonas sp. PY1]|uniref:c-type cytochrome n=1 Tax=Nitrosomonas sp. PY1 TaxID=1803906 RepID=UPI001FC80AE9|nr:cytochrome c [Nitrosomonas sp. PY1]GKS68763.1 hypothetical protein W03_07670 [Nitrosomonas sp. PY1]
MFSEIIGMQAAKLSRYAVWVVGLTISAASYASNDAVHIDHQVDEVVFQGWQVFSENCGSCHGDFGQGKIAPDLTQQIRTLSEEDFAHIVTNGKGLMPPWKANQEVMYSMRNMYRYLKARSDGVLQEGVPVKPR